MAVVRILIAEDHTDVREAIRVMLEEAGCEVLEAKDGKEALRALRSRSVDLVLCDVFMPEVDGLELICALRKEFPQLKIVVMSGGWSIFAENMLRTAVQLGAAGVISKPFEKSHLLRAVRRVLPDVPSRDLL
jgi:two-component system chemotaxis response regulator CheY